MVASFLVGLDTMVMITAMPTVIGQLGGISLYSWVFSSYLLTSTVTVPIYGKLSDLYGRRPVFIVSTTIFMVASVLAGQAQSMEQLIFFRFLQGIGAGGVQPITMIILSDIFTLEQRARVMGVFSSIWGIAALVGPALGGFLTEQVSWRWVFYINIPLALASIALVWLFLRENIQRREHWIDWTGAALLSGSVTALLFGLGSPGEGGAALDVPPPLMLGLSALLLALFIRQERRAPEPMLPLDIFANPLISVATITAALMGVAIFSQSTYVSPYLQGVIGLQPTLAGFIVAGSSLTWSAIAWVSGHMMLKWGYRVTAVFGGACVLLGALQLNLLQPSTDPWHVVLMLAIAGAGFGCISPVTMFASQNAVAWERRGVVTGANMFARTIGGTIGVSVAGALFAASIASSLGPSVDASQLLSEAGRAATNPAQLAAMQRTLDEALHAVYVFLSVVGVLTLLACMALPGGNVNQHAYVAPTTGNGPESRPGQPLAVGSGAGGR